MYARSAKQLKCPPTRDGSRTAANEWWQTKQADIDAQLGAAKQHPAQLVRDYQKAMDAMRLFARWQRRYGDVAIAGEAEAAGEWLEVALQSDAPPWPLEAWQADPLAILLRNHFGDTDQEFNRVVWAERFAQMEREETAENAPPKENTVRGYIDSFLELKNLGVGQNRQRGLFAHDRERLCGGGAVVYQIALGKEVDRTPPQSQLQAIGNPHPRQSPRVVQERRNRGLPENREAENEALSVADAQLRHVPCGHRHAETNGSGLETGADQSQANQDPRFKRQCSQGRLSALAGHFQVTERISFRSS